MLLLPQPFEGTYWLFVQAIWNHAMVHRKNLCKDSKNIKGFLAKFRSNFSEGGIGKGVLSVKMLSLASSLELA